MNTLVKADIFFFVTTIVVVLLGIAAVIASVYIIRILKDVSEITDSAKAEVERIVADVDELRSDLKHESRGLIGKAGAIGRFITRTINKK